MSKVIKFRPSSIDRVIKCPGSHKAEAAYPDQTSKQAAIGTAAHSLLEECFTEHLIPHDFIGRKYDIGGIEVVVDEKMADKVLAALDVYYDYAGVIQ
jgi:hypothetical protein